MSSSIGDDADERSGMFLYVTCPNVEVARSIAKTLVEERFVACANILPEMTSFYVWNGEVANDSESVLILKTWIDRMSVSVERVKSLHPYEVPCIVALPIVGGHLPFLEWLKAETRPVEL